MSNLNIKTTPHLRVLAFFFFFFLKIIATTILQCNCKKQKLGKLKAVEIGSRQCTKPQTLIYVHTSTTYALHAWDAYYTGDALC